MSDLRATADQLARQQLAAQRAPATASSDEDLQRLGDEIGACVRAIEQELRAAPHQLACAMRTEHDGIAVAWSTRDGGVTWGFHVRRSDGSAWEPWGSLPLLSRVVTAALLPPLARGVRQQVGQCLARGPAILASLRAWNGEP